MTNVNLEWALFYQQQGLSIIPVREKMPLIKWKEYQTKAADKWQIQKWFGDWPEADIGLVTGPITGRLVLDVDGEPGFNSIKDLPIPATQTVRTRRGVQYHFRWPTGFIGKTTVANIIPNKKNPEISGGVDVRGEGGYVKMPPSKCSDGTFYGFHDGKAIGQIELAEMPEWLREKLVKPLEQKAAIEISKDNWISEVIDGVGMGDRHEAFKKLAGYYFNIMHPDVAAQHLREWNSRNIPPMEDMEEKIADMTRRFKNGEYDSKFLGEKAEPVQLVTVNTDVNSYLNEIQRRTQFTRPEFRSGFGQLDKLTRGFQRQNIFVIGAPTNGGKTQFVLSCIHTLIKDGKKVLYFSTEMPQNEIKDRFNALGAKIPLDELRTGYLHRENKDKLVNYLNNTDTSNFIISPEDTPSIESIRMALQTSKPDIIIVDHIHHIKLRTDNRRTEIDDFISGLKKLILEKNLPCIVTAQLRRKEPMNGGPIHYSMHDFKESGGIENEAGVCLLLCPPDEWTDDKIQHVTAYVPKNRHGRREVRFMLDFDTAIPEFREPIGI